MQRLRHLGGCVATRPGVGHGHGCGNAIGREEEVAALSPQLIVQINGEGVVALDNRCSVRRGCG